VEINKKQGKEEEEANVEEKKGWMGVHDLTIFLLLA